MLDNVIQTSTAVGMTSLERSLANLVIDKDISYEEAVKYANRVDELKRLVTRK